MSLGTHTDPDGRRRRVSPSHQALDILPDSETETVPSARAWHTASFLREQNLLVTFGGERVTPASEGGDGDNNGRSNAAMPVLKVGGKAEHPTLGEVSVLVLGALGAKIEFFSVLW